MENQIEELREDLETEKSARTKAEKQRRELGEVRPGLIAVSLQLETKTKSKLNPVWWLLINPSRTFRIWSSLGEVVPN